MIFRDAPKRATGSSSGQPRAMNRMQREREQHALEKLQHGHLEEAEVIYRELIEEEAISETIFGNLAFVCGMQGKMQEMITLLKRAIAINPNYAEAYFNLGIGLKKQGNLQAAIDAYRQALVINPNYAEAYNNLGITLQGHGDLQAAIDAYRQALAINPNHPEAYLNLGVGLKEQGNLQAAIDAFRQALVIKTNYPDAYYNLGIALKEQGNLQAAIDAYRQALAINPSYAAVYNNLGIALHEESDLQVAIDTYRQALTIKPNYPEAYYNLGNALRDQGDLQAAIDAYCQALVINPDYPQAHCNLSLVQLLSGDYESGWKEYEWRFRAKGNPQPHAHPQVEQWNGSNLAPGESLILVSEQGLGDTLHFIRYVLYLNNTGQSATLCASTKLHDLIRASGITTVIYSPEQANQLTTGKWLPLLSLPGYLQVRPDHPIVDTPHIKAPEQQVDHWRQKLAAEQRPIIGINWSGNPKAEKGFLRGRSLPLETFAPIVEKTTVTLLSLQKGHGSEQLADCSFRHRFVGCQEDIHQTWDFVETAAMIANCHLVITSDTAVAHLAAGMGHPTWLLLTQIPDWRWGVEGESSFWYPSMRLFRQRERGNWPEVMERVATALEALLSHPEETNHQSLPECPKRVAGSSSGQPSAMSRMQREREQHALEQFQQGHLEEAEVIYRKFIEEGAISDTIFSNLAAICGMQGKTQEIIPLLRKAIAINPNLPDAYNNLGNALKEKGDLQAAIDAYRQALVIKPHYAEAYSNLGIALQDQGDLQAAIDAYRQALVIKPDYPEAYNNLGNALKKQDNLQAAIDAYRQALAINPDYPEAHCHLSLVQLLLDDYENGWKEYEWRFRLETKPHAYPQIERWTGSSLALEESLVLVSEQGLGDTLQFMRYVLYLNNTERSAAICAPVELHGLIRASEITTMIYSPEQANQLTTGKWLPLLSLPGYLQVRPDHPIVDTPYIKAPEQQVDHWRQKLAAEQRPIIGINWSGNPKAEKGSLRGRSLPLESFMPIVEKTTVTLLSLQKGHGSEQLADCSFRHRFVGCQEDISQAWDFVETAAMIANCDLVITSDTAVAHLAAGMGHPTWLLLTQIPDWRWGVEGESSFWYPSMRLFRQRERGNWPEVMERVATALEALLSHPEEISHQSLPECPKRVAGSSSGQPSAMSRMQREREQHALEQFQQGHLEEAEVIYRALIEEGGISHTIFGDLAAICGMQGRTQEMIPLLKKAIAVNPSYAEAYNNLGIALKKQGNLQAAVDAYRQALAVNPSYAEAYFNLGIALNEQGDLQAAIDAYRQALAIKPNYPQAYNNLGLALKDQGNLQAAIDAYRQALAINPNHAEAYNNLGIALKKQGDLQAAIDAYRQALAINPDYPVAHWNLSLVQLLLGDYENGWKEYEWRFQVKSNPQPHAHPQVERWTGSNLAPGESLILVSEQGLGDTLQFMRYALYLNNTGQSVSLCAQTSLHGLIRASGITTMVYSPQQANQLTTGKWFPLLSLTGYLQVRPDHPIVDTPYIKAPEQQVDHWRQKLAAEQRPIIGINWSGNPKAEKRSLRCRSLPLETFAPIVEKTTVTLLSLQKGSGSEQLADCSFRHRFVGCQEEINQTWDFVETAAMIANCHLVITSDTAVAHLAAGMGHPTWLLLTQIPDWRWGVEGESSFWYPSMRLFRQRERGNWTEVMERVATALEALLSHPEEISHQSLPECPKRVAGSSSGQPSAMSRMQREREQHALEKLQHGHLEEAEVIYRELIEEGAISETIFINLAVICGMQGRTQETIPLLRKAIAINPNYAEAYFNLGISLNKHGNLQAAIDAYRQALAINPNYPDAYNNLGIALQDQGDLQAAIDVCRQALAINSNYPQAYNNLGNALSKHGNLQAAIDAYYQALVINPDYPEAHCNLSLVQLLSGDYESGWKEYEWRFRAKGNPQPHAHPQVEQWNGSNLAPGESLILVSEQGLGDTLHFMRYVLYLNNTGQSATLCASTKLHDLIRASGITTVIYSPEQANQLTTGKWLPLLSLPGYLQVRPDHPIVDTPYIKAPEQQADHWRQKLAAEQRPIIGINWSGNPKAEKRSLRGRSLPLETFAPIVEKTTVTLLSLQKGHGSEQLANCSFRHRFVSCQEDINQTWDFVETAAIVANCDLIITSDTAVAHLAAGMGHPTWLLLTQMPEWRWGMEGESSFWYPSMRLFRQRERGNWTEVMERVATALAALLSHPKEAMPQYGAECPERVAGSSAGQPSAMSRMQREREQHALEKLQEGHLEEAEVIYRKLIEEGVVSDTIFGNLAAICGMQGRTQEIIPLLRKAIAINPNLPDAYNNLGNALKEQGDLQAAIDAYRQALVIKPHYAEAYSNLGNALKDQGDLQAAIDVCRQALVIKPGYAEAHSNLGNALKDQGDLQAAINAYRQALAIKPHYAEAYSNLGDALKDQGDLQAAIDAYRQALAINPNYAEVYNNLGIALIDQSDFQAAIDAYRQALAINPNYAEVYNNLGIALIDQSDFQAAIDAYRQALVINPNYLEAYNNLGIALMNQGDLQAAINVFRQALAINPNYPESYSNLGIVLKEQGNLQAAIDACHQALAIKPSYSEAYLNLGNALKKQDNLQAAIDAYRQALTIKPSYPEAYLNLGNALKKQDNLQAAIDAYRQALAINPDYPEAHCHLSLVQLLLGDYENGWKEYEWRLQLKNKPHAYPQIERWTGSSLASEESLVLVSEQGLGDTLQFMRYVLYLNNTERSAAICAQVELHGLIRASEITTMIYSPEQANQLTTGKWLPLLSLPGYLQVRPDHPIVDTPYIKVPEQQVDHWRQKLAAEQRPIIGINWSGNPKAEKGSLRGRSLPLESFMPIVEKTTVTLLSLQKGHGSEQLADCSFRHRFVGCQEDISQAWDFVETAAIIANCDLIITSDTAVAHLAAGMGHPTWLLLTQIPDWRWGVEGESSFWYPSMRLFRQRERGNWPEVMERVATALAALLSHPEEISHQSLPECPKRVAGSSSGQPSAMSRMQREREQHALEKLQEGHLEEAEVIYRALIEEGGISHTIFGDLAAICGMQGRTQEMIPLLKKAIAVNPSYAEAYNNLGIALKKQGNLQAAVDAYRQALAVNPSYAEAYFNLGIALNEQGDLQAAIDAYRQALAIKPNYPQAYNNLGLALKDQGNLRDAINAYRQALSIKPNYPAAYSNLGNALKDYGDLQAAIDAYGQALAIKPNYPQAYNNLANALKEQGDLQAAIDAYRQALAINPDYPEAHCNLSLVQLLSGDYESGWKEYEWRFRAKKGNPQPHAHPQVEQWNGSNLAPGESLILVSEQGLGDTLHFMRYVLYLNNTGQSATLCASTKLHDLIRASGITTVIYSPEQANQLTTGKWLPLLSLPGYLQVRPDHPIVDTPYIKAPEQQVDHWRQKLAAEQRPIIGINWSGNPKAEKGFLRGRSLPLESFMPTVEKTTVTLLSLQKGHGSEQLTGCSFRHRFVGCQEDISQAWDFVETAAIIANCDLIITSDTAVAHLAAGMGHPTWLLLTQIPDWRWGMEGENSFWYPSMRLFRQRERGNWTEVMERVATALAALLSHPEEISHQSLPECPKRVAGSSSGQPSAMSRMQREREQHALEKLQHGHLEEAEVICRELIEEGAISETIFINLAVICGMQGRTQETILLLRKAIAINPNYAEAYSNLGNALKDQGDLQAAIDAYRQALVINPNYAEAYSNLGNALKDQGDLQAAIDAYRQALVIKPHYAEAYSNLGNALKDQGDLQAAINAYRQALVIKPDYAEAHSNLGNALKDQGDLQAAIDAYRQALAINPNYVEVYNNLGIALIDQSDFQAAIDAYRQALAINPNYAEVYNNLGIALIDQSDFQAAIDTYRQALDINPSLLNAYSNLGIALQNQGDLQVAIDIYRQALAINPDYPVAHWNLSLLQLLLGDYENGWKEYEWRFRLETKPHAYPQIERWTGGSLASGESLILVSEQGLGDTLQFMRYAFYLNNTGRSAALCAQVKLHDLIRSSGVTTVIYSPEQANQLTTGKWFPLLSLPGYLQVRPDHPIVDTPYIKVPEEQIDYWRQKLAAEQRPIIGINWSGSPNIEKRSLRGRSLPLETFAPIVEKTTVTLLSLQKGYGSEQLADCSFRHRFVGCQEDVDQTWDFVETAAMIANCHLVITSDTAVAHLAAGMGHPTWLLLTQMPDWRWGMEGESSFWYPSMRLFRQRERGNWTEVMERVATALATLLSHPEETNHQDLTECPKRVAGSSSGQSDVMDRMWRKRNNTPWSNFNKVILKKLKLSIENLLKKGPSATQSLATWPPSAGCKGKRKR